MRPSFSFTHIRLPGNKPAGNKPATRRQSSESTILTSSSKDDDNFCCLVDSIEKYAAGGRRATVAVYDDDEYCVITLHDATKIKLSLKDLCIAIQTQISLATPLSNYRMMQLEDKDLVHVEYNHVDHEVSLAQYLVLDDFLFLDEELLHESIDDFALVARGLAEKQKSNPSRAERPKRNAKQLRRNSV